MKCKSIRDLDQEYQREIQEHQIREKNEKKPSKEYEEYLQIGDRLHRIALSCKNEITLNKQSCHDISQAKESWKIEMVKYGLFLRFSPKKKKQYQNMISELETHLEKDCR